jgi:hypothetical protein
VLLANHSLIFWRILQKTILCSGFKNPSGESTFSLRDGILGRKFNEKDSSLLLHAIHSLFFLADFTENRYSALVLKIRLVSTFSEMEFLGVNLTKRLESLLPRANSQSHLLLADFRETGTLIWF